jgi:DNA-binding XRE family transcriptional regulator
MNLALKTRILASGKSQILFAREIGISEPQLSKIVGGWIDPCEETKRKIAKILNCEVNDIFPPEVLHG